MEAKIAAEKARLISEALSSNETQDQLPRVLRNEPRSQRWMADTQNVIAALLAVRCIAWLDAVVQFTIARRNE
jgi:hypothetical protein